MILHIAGRRILSIAADSFRSFARRLVIDPPAAGFLIFRIDKGSATMSIADTAASSITFPELVKRFLDRIGSPHAHRFHAGLELQIMPKVDGKTFATDDERDPWRIRIPANANTSPVDNTGKGVYAEALMARIGTTGWNWRELRSEFVGFDFDSIAEHAGGLNLDKLDAILEAVKQLPYVSVHKSKSATAYHLYVEFANPPATANHTEHAALAKGVLAKMAADCGHDLQADVDCAGGNLWIWSDDAAPEGFALVPRNRHSWRQPIA